MCNGDAFTRFAVIGDVERRVILTRSHCEPVCAATVRQDTVPERVWLLRLSEKSQTDNEGQRHSAKHKPLAHNNE